MSLRLQLVLTLLLAAVVAGGWLWFAGAENGEAARGPNGRPDGGPGAATLVVVEPLALVTDRVEVRAVGTGDAQRSAQIHPAVSGEVIEISFQAEQKVEKGALLIRLDDAHQQLAVRLAQVAVKEAKREVERVEKLATSGAVTQVRLQDSQSALESASLRLQQARAELADRTVSAPFDGVIGLTEVDVGDRLTEDSMIATLDDRSVILVDFNLPEDYAGQVALGDPVSVRPWSQPDQVLEGTISATGSRIDPTSRSLKVRARIPNPDDRIRPGTSFEVTLGFTGADYPSVREVAVLWSRDGAYLWRARDGKADKVFVDLIRRDAGRVLIDGPLDAGDLIVIEGVQGLRVDQALDPVPLGSEAAAKAGLRPDPGSAGGS